MTSAPRCQAQGGAVNCTDPDCPEKRYRAAALTAAAKANNFEAFAAAKESAKPSFKSVKLPSDLRKVVKSLYPDVRFDLAGDGRDGAFVTLNLIKIPESEKGVGLGTKLMGELVKAADKNGWNLALSPSGDFGSSKVRLEVFYRRFGFRPNKGRTRDFATQETMVRYPLL